MSDRRLTTQVKAGGCASKLSPKVLDQVLGALPKQTNPHVLVGFDTSDDAGVYQISADTALVQTVDFFTPIVDDPYVFGAIAAANALSDVYAMGGSPISSLSVLTWPRDGNLEDLGQILLGGADKMREAGCVILGGHSVADTEPKFGYAVTGLVHPDRVLTNAGAKPGDAIVFTKKIGTGVISTALKQGTVLTEHMDGAIVSMLTLNNHACRAMLATRAHACTDITGFGLMGHSREMAVASGVTLVIDTAAVPLLPGAYEYAAAGAIPGGLRNNLDFAGCTVRNLGEIDPVLEQLLFDPQTSGGLLIAVPEEDVEKMQSLYPMARRIGHVEARGEKPLELK
ncbi:MAG TPA: selenide, water dikinase SelD [Bryobacteraceae bacterium]|nr:selenide, water dikinase SelD [Bryobacteraceae bacterium]